MEKFHILLGTIAAILIMLTALIIQQYQGPSLAGVTNFDSLTVGEALVVDGLSTLTGTSTVTQSVDGLVVGGTLTISTTSRQTLYTNSTGPKFCTQSVSALHVATMQAFAPSLIFAIGTSTSAANPEVNLIASTTVATTTDTLVDAASDDSNFILKTGETVVSLIADYMTTGASSTYYGNWNAEYFLWCTDISTVQG